MFGIVRRLLKEHFCLIRFDEADYQTALVELGQYLTISDKSQPCV